MATKHLRPLKIQVYGGNPFDPLDIVTEPIEPGEQPWQTIKTGLIAYHDLTANANDQHSTHNGTVNGTVAIDANGAYFDGTEGNNIQLPQGLMQAMYGATAISYAGWFEKDTGAQTNSRMMGMVVSGSDTRTLLWDVGGSVRVRARSSSADDNQDVTTTATYSGKTFVAGVIDFTAKTIQVYVNGSLITTGTSLAFGVDAFSEESGTANYYGRFPSWNNNERFIGWLSRFGWWGNGLTASEVTWLYNDGIGRLYGELTP